MYVRIYSKVCDIFFFFKQKTAYEVRISDWSSDVCSSDLGAEPQRSRLPRMPRRTCFTEHLKIVDRRARRAEQRQRFRLCVERVETLRLAGRPMSRPAIPGEHHAQARPLSIGKVAPPDLEQPHARRHDRNSTWEGQR